MRCPLFPRGHFAFSAMTQEVLRVCLTLTKQFTPGFRQGLSRYWGVVLEIMGVHDHKSGVVSQLFGEVVKQK